MSREQILEQALTQAIEDMIWMLGGWRSDVPTATVMLANKYIQQAQRALARAKKVKDAQIN